MEGYKERKNEKCRSGRSSGRRMFFLAAAVVAFGLLLHPEALVFAADTATDLANFQPLTVLKTVASIFLSIIAIIGYIIVGKSVMEIGNGIQNSENAAITSGLKGLAGGGIMAVVPTLMVIFGFVL